MIIIPIREGAFKQPIIKKWPFERYMYLTLPSPTHGMHYLQSNSLTCEIIKN